jgi:hypothetical protein
LAKTLGRHEISFQVELPTKACAIQKKVAFRPRESVALSRKRMAAIDRGYLPYRGKTTQNHRPNETKNFRARQPIAATLFGLPFSMLLDYTFGTRYNVDVKNGVASRIDSS